MCLDHYTSQLEQQTETHIITNPGPGTGLTKQAVLFHNTGMTSSVNLPEIIRPEKVKTAPAGAGAGCQSCPKYRQLLSDVLRDILKYQDFASVMTTSSKNLFHLGVRKCSTFNLLYEAAVLKETAGVSPPANVSTVKHISDVRNHAASELNRLDKMPATSYKWTWGESLTEEDIINLRRPGTKPGPGPHSGYDVSLVQGKMEGDYSDGPSSSFSSNNLNEELPGEALFIPPATDLQLPVYFSKRDIRKYNPLYTGSGSPEPVQTQLELAGSWLAGSDNNSGMEPSGEPVPVASILNLADCWLTRSDHESGSETSGLLEPGLGSSVPVPVNLAKTWLAGSDSGPDLSSASEPVPVLNLADSWVAGVPESVHKETGPEHPLILPLNIAEGWLAGYENDSGDDRSSVPDPVSGSEQIPEPVLSSLIAPVPLNLAETWLAGSNHGSGSEGSSMPELGHSVLDLADTWGQDLEASGSSHR